MGEPEPEVMFQIVCDLAEALKNGESILMYCFAGEGRSGMVVEALLRYLGHTKDVRKKIRLINKHYVERWRQEKYLDMFGHALQLTETINDQDRRKELICACITSWSWIYSTGKKEVLKKNTKLVVGKLLNVKVDNTSYACKIHVVHVKDDGTYTYTIKWIDPDVPEGAQTTNFKLKDFCQSWVNE